MKSRQEKQSAERSAAPAPPMPETVVRRDEARAAKATREPLGRPRSGHESPPATPPESRRDTRPATVEKESRKKGYYKTKGPGSFA